MPAALDVSLRDQKPPESTEQWNARLPSRWVEYIKAEASASGRTQAGVVLDALELEKDVAERLAASKSRLKAFAAERGLDLTDDMSEVFSELIVIGLGCYEKKPKK